MCETRKTPGCVCTRLLNTRASKIMPSRTGDRAFGRLIIIMLVYVYIHFYYYIHNIILTTITQRNDRASVMVYVWLRENEGVATIIRTTCAQYIMLTKMSESSASSSIAMLPVPENS